ncbi:ABC transporter substrate-binding protein [Aureimonas endophytica]|uniref:ABC transporter substrate-binding protein n=1 Tax=Aureimonas endophytica TaxID=2027858 RepID=A0A917E8I7_9HYPH|nr:extracellular solute-binding protein [Aureimonas endophytica]GGE09750.1 ABC transporter substrate-binding protein [Aureimonas endophytica]
MSSACLSRRRFGQLALGAGAAAALPRPLFAEVPADTPVHGLSAYGDLKYGPDFQAFDYANPAAPKGGTLNLSVPNWYLNQSPQTFDTLNTFTLQGNAAPRLEKLYDSLMVGALDEPDAIYGALAESVAISVDRNSFTFRLRPEARFSTGAPVTAEDVVFSYRLMKEKGHPSLTITLRDLTDAVAEDARTVRLVFSGRQTPQSVLEAFQPVMPILPKSFFDGRDFERTGLTEIPGSGPYRIGRFETGRFIEYHRREDYWARDLPFARGLDHFDILRIDFFRDRQPALEAFKKGQITFREEFTTRSWASEYDFPAVREKRVVKAEFPQEKRPRFQCWALNQRRERFREVKVRRAINLCFDFEWTNANLLFGLRSHSDSPFEGSDYKATGKPSPEELALLDPLRGQLPEEVFGEVWAQPVSDASGNDRKLLREALRLFSEAGWTQRNGRLSNARGEAFTLEFMINGAEQQRVYGKFFETLRRLGVDATFRLVDEAQYQDRQRRFDYDMILAAFSLSATPTQPSLELFFGSKQRDVEGSYNFPGMADAGVDALIERVGAARDRASFTIAMRCLDRLLRARLDWLPNIGAGMHRVAYWDMFGFRQPKPDYGFPVESLWWYDEAKAKAIGRA